MQLVLSFKATGYGTYPSTPVTDDSALFKAQILHSRSKIIENLAVVNYDTNNMVLAPYDWRLSYYNLEVRDGYFSRLKTSIEGLK